LNRRRLDLGLLWRDVAREIGTGATNVANWSKGHSKPGLEFWPRVIQFLGYDPRPPATSLGDRLTQRREGQGLSQKELACALEVDPNTLARWERKQRVPTGKFRVRVDRFLSQ
jgi:DNA-binding transcriptional regulator YiaG